MTMICLELQKEESVMFPKDELAMMDFKIKN